MEELWIDKRCIGGNVEYGVRDAVEGGVAGVRHWRARVNRWRGSCGVRLVGVADDDADI